MRKVFVAENPAQAHLVAGLLEEEGIRAVVEGEMLTGARFAIGMDASTLPTVFVNDEDAVRAGAALRTRNLEAAAQDEKPAADRPGLAMFKTFLLLWIVASAAGVLVGLVTHPVGLALCAAFAACGAFLVRLVRRPAK
jgi:hypothetical protein